MDAGRNVRISIVIPTFNRRRVVLGTLGALNFLESASAFEVIVVDDGSHDGTSDAISDLTVNYDLQILTQHNAGAGAARNKGASVARGEIIIFLDDDMIADRHLLMEHEKALATWDAAVGHIPVDEDSPQSVLKTGLERWVAKRHARLSRSSAQLKLGDLLTGQLSVRAELFHRLGGFDEQFNRNGTFGAEDTDFLYRLLESGAKTTYLSSAISHQHYVVTPSQYLRQWAQGGGADATLVKKHPSLRAHIFRAHGGRLTHRILGASSAWLISDRAIANACSRSISRVEKGTSSSFTHWLFVQLRDSLYWRNYDDHVRRGRTFALSVIAYHSISDVNELAPYTTTTDELKNHLIEFHRAGYRIITLAEAIEHLKGKPLEHQSVLLTFDDGYSSVLHHAKPILSQANVTAVVFAVSGQIGGTNVWDSCEGRAVKPLMTVDELEDLQKSGWAVAGHTHNHPHLTQLSGASLEQELGESVQALQLNNWDVPFVLAYPYGEHDSRVRAAAARAGYSYAFGLGGGAASSKKKEYLRIPRTEIRAGMSGRDVIEAMTFPHPVDKNRLSREARGMIHQILPWLGSTVRVQENFDSPQEQATRESA